MIIVPLEQIELPTLEMIVRNQELELIALKDKQKQLRVEGGICKWGSIIGLAATAVGAAIYLIGGQDTEPIATKLMSSGGPIGGFALLGYSLYSLALKQKKYTEIPELEKKLDEFKIYVQRLQKQEHAFYNPN